MSIRSKKPLNEMIIQFLPERRDGHPNPLAVRLLELAHLRGLLHAEVDLVAVLPHHLQLDVLRVAHFAVVLMFAVCVLLRCWAEWN